jgi:hypothetical protein
VHDFGAGDLLAVRAANGRSSFHRFTRDAAPLVDIKARLIVVIPQADAEDIPDDEDAP